ncbi:hypothetical protein LTR16_002802 [Cryomyces antarcticus]|uniref:Uncharacterized protein n=1 Tax=Cryomyces antarcticus TaxID=329879 RepID=A0ABR0LPC2_9PEZI|nr:hypothetical protein LTR04_005040 [Oleoguttula sp. CCFEE 6159]KAK5201403.1 hypothetical protein LTR16_002802 [Cryomyces antarcticus]
MASIIIGCAALISDRVQKRRRAKQEVKQEYADRFEELKAENEKRVRGLSSASQEKRAASGTAAGEPPAYESVVDTRRSSVDERDRTSVEADGREGRHRPEEA